ncbi:hypothetical protein KDL29_07965 [bacterium]|nr:hypothetical protein [bacterium]UNM09178.1 MAG: hypothetical protein H7A35_03790 [Planctomycetales bacterium]
MCALISGDGCISQLNGVRMSPVKTDPKGVVNQDTVFTFSMEDGIVTADYRGGSVLRGYLIGRCSGSSMEFSYCQMNDTGNVAGGRSHAELALMPDGRLRMVEHFTFDDGRKGVNIIEQRTD